MINLSADKDKLIILASSSKARADMLSNVGIKFKTIHPDIDETEIISNLKKKGASSGEIAQILATEKAFAIAAKYPKAIVIGSDQVLEFEGSILSKSKTPESAFEKLKRLRGQEHHLISAVSVVQGDQELWSYKDSATLSMCDLSDEALQRYSIKAGKALTTAVGGYWLEGMGAWLFSAVKGDYFTILGMPLLPLLSYLRENHRGDYQP